MNRREILIGAVALAPALAARADKPDAAQSQSAAQPPGKLKILIAGGHPGDPEYGCGGTVARFTALGHNVTLLYLNDGAWPPTPAATRLAEARKAAEILHAHPAWAGQTNGHAIVDNEHYEAYLKLIEAEKPDAVFNHWPIDNHRDHRAIAQLTYDAWNALGRKFTLYYYEVSDGEDTLQFNPSVFVDIAETEAVKRSACYAHASQNPDGFYRLQDSVAAFRGIQSGYKRAEAFIRQTQSPYDIFARAGIETR